MTTRLLLDISDNQGYSPEQVETKFTLGELLEFTEEAIQEFGEDAIIVLSNGQRYGAGYGRINHPRYGELFRDANEDEEEDY